MDQAKLSFSDQLCVSLVLSIVLQLKLDDYSPLFKGQIEGI
jgi:hypothetical protein